MSQSSEPTELALEFVALNDYLYTDGDAAETLQRLVDLAVHSIAPCRWAAISAWPKNHRPYSLASSDGVASNVDRLQYERRDGPCLVAAADDEVVRITDLDRDRRWPTFAAAVRSLTPVRSILSFPLVERPVRSALNLYAGEVDVFDDDAVSVAALFAAHARVLLIHAASTGDAANLRHALTSSRQIGAAIGILMSAHRITSDQAFDLLRLTSQSLNRKLQDIAFDVTQTGILPESGAVAPA
jgi:hypothetical protein